MLEARRVMTLPATMLVAEGYAVAYNSPTGDVVADTLSFDAFINSSNDVDSYYFAPQFTGSYTIDVGDFNNGVDPEVAVYNASTGIRIGYNDDASILNDDARLVLNLTADVRYIVAVADQPASATGDVSLRIMGPSATSSQSLFPNAFGDGSTSVNLNVNTDIDYFTITAPADATGNLAIVPIGATFTPRLALFDASGAMVAGPAASINYAGVVPGQAYRVAVFSSNYASSGNATLNYNFSDITAVVTNTADSGPGSLRQAMLDANAHANEGGLPDKIRFAIPGAGPHTISLSSPLPNVTEAVIIDGSTQPGTGDFPSVAIDGGNLTGAIDGLRVFANDSTIRKLNIRRFPQDGVLVRANNVLLESLAVGSDWTVENAAGNAGYGIQVIGSNNTIFSTNVHANGLSGIYINGEASDNNTIVSGGIGLALNGVSALPNAGNGILIADGDATRIQQVYISGNLQSGISLIGSATATNIVGNFIGTSLSGTRGVFNGGDGIRVESSGNKIGGPSVSEGNTISGNRGNGISILGPAASNNTVEGNLIGTNATGTGPIPNQGMGIHVVSAANTRIGSATEVAGGNVISANRNVGIVLEGGVNGSTVYGNKIGTAKNGNTALRNIGNGILITSGATGVTIGGDTSIKRNIISGNNGAGVSITSSSSNITIAGNFIGTTANGEAPLGNSQAGIKIEGSNNQIGGPTFRFGNRIAGNPIGINMTGSSGQSANQNTIRFNTIGTTAAPNTIAGIQFSNNASNNTVGPANTIQANGTGILANDGSINNRFTRNSFSSNTALGIDLLPVAGVNPQDAGDADLGANRGQNSPTVIGSPLKVGNDLRINFLVNSSAANSAYPLAIEFYSSDGAGEGQRYLAGTTFTLADLTNGRKLVNFAGVASNLVAGTTKIVALATDANGNTSEFSTESLLAVPIAASALPLNMPQASGAADGNRVGVASPDSFTVANLVHAQPQRSVGEGVVRQDDSNGLLRFDTNDESWASPVDHLQNTPWIQHASQTRSTGEMTRKKEVSENDQAVEELLREFDLKGTLLS